MITLLITVLLCCSATQSLHEFGETFLKAAQSGRVDIVETVFEKIGPEILQYKDEDGYTALHRASYNGHVKVVEYLLTVGAEIDSKTNDGWQPLHCACQWNKVEVASILLQNGSNINSLTNGKQTPLHLASSNPKAAVTLELLLMTPGIDASIVNMKGETALDLCSTLSKNAYLFEMVEECINM